VVQPGAPRGCHRDGTGRAHQGSPQTRRRSRPATWGG
jgi:hypothetical protein